MLVLTVVLELGCEACASHDPAYLANALLEFLLLRSVEACLGHLGIGIASFLTGRVERVWVHVEQFGTHHRRRFNRGTLCV